MQTATMETPAMIAERELIQERRIRFLDFYRDIERHARQLWTDEEGSKTLLKRMRASITTLQDQVRLFSDTNDNTGQISTAVDSIRGAAVDLRVLDPRLDWIVGLVLSSCESFKRVLSDKFPPTKQVQPVDPAEINPKRMHLLDLVDDLSAKLLTLGDWSHGGVEERRPIIAKAGDLRRSVHSDITSDLADHQKLAGMVRDVMQGVADLGQLQSRVTNQVGFMRASMPAIMAHCERILALLASSAPPARQRGSLSIKP